MTDSTPRPIIRFDQVTKRFGRSVTAVDSVSLDIGEGEFFALLGPSGCGKTTLLRMLAGFETPTEGRVLIDGEDMSDVPPNRRPVNMVFQSYAVFPHMSVARNVGYGLRLERVGRAEIDERVQEALNLVQLGEYGDRMPDQLSGGQRQRVALARALVKRPRVLLLDEPLSALDAKLREAMQLELVRLQQTVGITFVIVTHDQDEALSMADRIAVMEKGAVRQLAPPRELYEFPKTRFVADFIGKMNLFTGRTNGGTVAVDGIGPIAVGGAGSLPDGSEVSLAVRPEKVAVIEGDPPPPEDGCAIDARISALSYHGNETHIYAETASGQRLSVTVQNGSRHGARDFAKGETIRMGWRHEDVVLLTD